MERPIDEFRVNKQGKRFKTCLKHSKKRDISLALPEVDHRDSFLHEIKNFSLLEDRVIESSPSSSVTKSNP